MILRAPDARQLAAMAVLTLAVLRALPAAFLVDLEYRRLVEAGDSMVGKAEPPAAWKPWSEWVAANRDSLGARNIHRVELAARASLLTLAAGLAGYATIQPGAFGRRGRIEPGTAGLLARTAMGMVIGSELVPTVGARAGALVFLLVGPGRHEFLTWALLGGWLVGALGSGRRRPATCRERAARPIGLAWFGLHVVDLTLWPLIFG